MTSFLRTAQGTRTAWVCMHAHNPLLLELPPEAPSVRTARAAVSQVAARCGVHVANVALCVSEAVTNAVVHAFRDREGRSGTIRVLAECTDGRMLHVSVEDDGVGFSPRPDSPGLGLGLGLISTLTSSMEISATDKGSRICMRFEAAS